MSIINDIEIKNFKSIRHQKIEGCKRINVFVGEPNVGKSNILEAISLFSVYHKTANFSDFIRVGKNTTLFFNGTIEKPIEVILNSYFRARVVYEKGGLFTSLQEDRFGDGFENIDKAIEDISVSLKTDARDNLLIKGSYIINDKSEIKYEGSSYLNLYDSAIKDKAIERTNKKSPILKYEFKKSILYNSKEAYSLNHPFGENIFEIISTKTELHKSIIDLLNKYGLKFLYDSEIQEYKILNLLGDKFFTVPYFMIADTLRRLIFHKAAIASNKNAVLLFEEPEANMYPPYISKLTSDIMYDENENQFFIATHSPYVVNDFMENLKKDDYAIYTVGYDKENGETLIRRMTDEELHEIYQYGVDLFLNLENFLPHAQQQ
jgi:AAA15 family ATPase/GTPase